MRIEARVFVAGMVFFAPVGIVYGVVTDWYEEVGTTAILLAAGLSGLIGLYLGALSRRIDERPEDDPAGEVSDGAGELGTFAPHSWWPLAVAVATALTFAGLAVGWWLVLIGLPLVVLATVGWVFEFQRGGYAR